MRKELMDDGFYLGDPSILDKAAWVRADRLAVRRELMETDGLLSVNIYFGMFYSR